MDPEPPSLFLAIIDFSFVFPVLGLLVLLLFSALVSGSEVAFFSLTPTDIDELKKSEADKDSQALILLKEPNKLLGVILISNNFINIAIVILSSIIFTPILEIWSRGGWQIFNFYIEAVDVAFILQLILVTFVILLFGEILPKIYATKNGLPLVRLMVKPMIFIEKFVGPLNRLLNVFTNWLDKPVKQENITVSDLEHALDLTEDSEVEDEGQKILRGIVKFGSTAVRQIMTPRPDVVALDVNDNYTVLMEVVKESGFSRIPVYDDSFDNVKGTLYIKDLLPYIDEAKNFEWTKFIRDPFYVPENKKIDDLLKEFQEKKIHMAIVVDEFGGTSGIISLEDVLEEIVGEISDEFDDEDLVYSKLDDKNYVFEGKISISEFCKVLDLDDEIFNDAKGDAESLAGLILEIAGKFPVKGDLIAFEDFEFRIESIIERRIQQVKVTLL